MKFSWKDGPVFHYSEAEFSVYYKRVWSVGGLEGGSRTEYSLLPWPREVHPEEWDQVTDSQIILVPLDLALPHLKKIAGQVRVNSDFSDPYVSVESPDRYNTYLISYFKIDGREYLGFPANGRRTWKI